MLNKKTIILGICFVIAGFLSSWFIFFVLTKEKTSTFSNIVISTPQKSAQIISVKQETAPAEIAPPDQKTKQESQEIIEPALKEIPTLVLNGVFTSETGNVALINNRIVKEGDLVLGVKIAKIYSDRVEVDADGQKVMLRVK